MILYGVCSRQAERKGGESIVQWWMWRAESWTTDFSFHCITNDQTKAFELSDQHDSAKVIEFTLTPGRAIELQPQEIELQDDIIQSVERSAVVVVDSEDKP